MKNNAKQLRTLVMDNALELGRLNKEAVGKEDYAELTTLYQNCLDALTEWASKDYAHKSTTEDSDKAFQTAKAILDLYATDEDRVIIDQSSMRTMRDCATKPKRLYSSEYTKAEKARKAQAKTVSERYTDLLTLGAPERNDEETLESYVARILEAKVNTKVDSIDMLELYKNANATLTVKTKAVEDIKAKGNWTWKRPIAVATNEFAELIENYIADCLIDNYNLKSSKVVRDEAKAAREQAKAEKANASK